MGIVGRSPVRAATLLTIHRGALRVSGDGRTRVSAIASSLRLPDETVRRAAHGLATIGLLRPTDGGLVVPQDFLEHRLVRDAATRYEALFDALVTEFARDGIDVGLRLDDLSRETKVIAALDIYLSVFELAELAPTRPMALYVIGLVSVLNAAGITYHPVLRRRYGHDDTVPPVSVRQPASLAALAAVDGFSKATLLRHLRAAEESGALRTVAGGYLLADRLIDDPDTSVRTRTRIWYVRRVMQDCRALHDQILPLAS